VSEAMGRKESNSLSERQLELMTVIWELREGTVSQVWRALSERRKMARNTVHTMMVRLKEQGWLNVRIEESTHYFSAAKSQRRVTSSLVSRLLKAAFSDSPSRLFMALVDSKRLSSEEAAHIRKLIDEAEGRDK
jgi:BlaI family penicillinase repressor